MKLTHRIQTIHWEQAQTFSLIRLPFYVRYSASLILCASTLGYLNWIEIKTDILVYQIPLAAVILSTFLGGAGCGVFALLVCTIGIHYFFLIPGTSLFDFQAWEVPLLVLDVLGIFFVYMIHQLHRSSIRVQRERDRFQKLVDWLDHAIVFEMDAKNFQTRFVSEGTERLLSYPKKNWFDHPGYIFELVHTDDLQKLREAIQRVIETEHDHSCLHRMRKSNGQYSWYRTGFHFDREGRLEKVSGLSVDIHLLKTAEEDNSKLYEQSKKALQLRDDLMAIVSHDLRNPLLTILMNAELILKGVSSGSKSAAAIKRAGNKMNQLIEDLLCFAKVEAGKLVLSPKICRVADLFNDVMDLFEPSLESKAIRVEKKFSEANLSVNCDPMRIYQVLSNLLSNAIKYSPIDGVIRLSAEVVNDQVVISVSDQGHGIDAENLPHVFDRYWQAKSSVPGGTGIGLSIAKGIVEAHGGQIWVKSEVSRGTTFFFALKALKADAYPSDYVA